MAGNRIQVRRRAALLRALALVTEALDLIDAHRGPPEAAAHLDVAIQKIRGDLGPADSKG